MCKIEQPDTQQHNGVRKTEKEMCMWKQSCYDYLKPLSKMSTLRVGSLYSAFFRNYHRTKGCRNRDELVEVIVCTFNTIYCFHFAPLVVVVMLSKYAKESSVHSPTCTHPHTLAHTHMYTHPHAHSPTHTCSRYPREQ